MICSLKKYFHLTYIDEELKEKLERAKYYKQQMIEKWDGLYNLPDQGEEYVKMIEERLANEWFEDSRYLVTEYAFHSEYYKKMVAYGFPLTLEWFKQFTCAKRESWKHGKSGDIERIS